MTRTHAQVGKANRDKGARAELAVVKWLRDNGWPGAERAIATGHRSTVRERADQGDITGTPGIAWQVTDRGDLEQPAVFNQRLGDAEAQRAAAGADYGLLVERRRGVADAGRWWVHLPGNAFACLLVSIADPLYHQPPVVDCTVRVTLGGLIPLLRQAGYGTALITISSREEHL